MNYKTVGKPLSQVNYSEKKKNKRKGSVLHMYIICRAMKTLRCNGLKITINMHLKPPPEFSRSQETYLKILIWLSSALFSIDC